MKKALIVLVVLALLLVVAPWSIGKLAEKRIDHGLDQFVAQAPYLSIVERTWTSGWFRSGQDVTFAVSGPWMRAVNLGSAGNDTVRFAVRNEVLHGPVLGFSGFGLARVNSKVVFNDAVRKKLIELFGTDEPVRASTRVGFFGGGTTTFSGDERSVKVGGESRGVSWDAFKLSVSYSRNLDSVDLDGKWPRLELRNASSGTSVLLREVTLEADNERVSGNLYDTDFTVAIDSARIVGADQDAVEVADIQYGADTASDGDYMSFAAKIGSGSVRSKQLADKGLELEEVHYDFTLRRLHTETLAKMMTAIKASQELSVAGAAGVDAAKFGPIKEHGMALLKHDPEFVIDRIGFATVDGDGYIKGLIRLKGVTEEDLSTGGLSLITKLDAEINVDFSQKMVDKLPGGAAAVGNMVDEGTLKRERDRYVSKIELRHGELRVNGKAQGFPGLGPPPAPMTPEAPPPAE
jgi:uncharacterized protein YdgA (DUF945 family)